MQEDKRWGLNLSCHYSSTFGMATFEDSSNVVQSTMLQDATGVNFDIVDICLCMAGAEPVATTAKGFAFMLLTQPCKEGNRVISLQIMSKGATFGKPDMEGKPPSPDIHFYDGWHL